MVEEKLKRELGFRDVILFYIVSGLSLRWIATAAATGQSAITVWVLAFCGFFLPLAGCILELSSRYPQEGGLYIWTREAYGDFAGFIAAWCYWMSNLPYFAAVLYFAASSLLFTTPRAARLADANVYFLLFTIGMLTLITVLNVFGLGLGKWLNNLGAVGMAVPVVILILLGLLSFSRFGSATHFTWAGFIPHVQVRDLIFWSTIFFAFTGSECASFMGDEIKDARRVVPRSLVIAGVIITLSYIAGTTSMLVALPSSRISGLGGFMTAIDFLCRRLGVGCADCPGRNPGGDQQCRRGRGVSFIHGPAAFCGGDQPLPACGFWENPPAMENSLCRNHFLRARGNRVWLIEPGRHKCKGRV